MWHQPSPAWQAHFHPLQFSSSFHPALTLTLEVQEFWELNPQPWPSSALALPLSLRAAILSSLNSSYKPLMQPFCPEPSDGFRITSKVCVVSLLGCLAHSLFLCPRLYCLSGTTSVVCFPQTSKAGRDVGRPHTVAPPYGVTSALSAIMSTGDHLHRVFLTKKLLKVWFIFFYLPETPNAGVSPHPLSGTEFLCELPSQTRDPPTNASTSKGWDKGMRHHWPAIAPFIMKEEG